MHMILSVGAKADNFSLLLQISHCVYTNYRKIDIF